MLGARSRKDGYVEGNGWLVSWCVGHLVELAPADAYDPRYSKWAYDDLPIVPQPWQFQVLPDTRKQFNILRQLMCRDDVDTVVCATDAGREGELIFRLTYNLCQCTKPVKRLWISSMEESAIRKGFDNLADGRKYDNLYAAALCRAKADWLIGINGTRLFTTLYKGKTLNVGRVLTPTLTLLAEREAAIEHFKKEKFYTVELDAQGLRAASGKFNSKTDAEKLRSACLGKTAVVQSIAKKDKTERPPKLYDLTTLQREANRLFDYTAQQALDYLQSLYEKRLATYPRTDSRYLTEDMAEGLPALCSTVAGALSFMEGQPLPVNAAQVVDSSKVTDHHAVIPTAEIAGADLAALPTGERNILYMIAVRLLCAVGEPHTYAETAVTLDCGGASFMTKGRTVAAAGWKGTEKAFLSTLKKKAEEPAPALPELAVWGVCDQDPRGSAIYSEYFAEDTSPKVYCDVHVKLPVCTESGMAAVEGCPGTEEKVFLILPEGSGETEDSRFAVPENCPIHGDSLEESGEVPEGDMWESAEDWELWEDWMGESWSWERMDLASLLFAGTNASRKSEYASSRPRAVPPRQRITEKMVKAQSFSSHRERSSCICM